MRGGPPGRPALAATPRLHLAVTAHGLGHWTRSAAVARALRALRPELELHVSAALPEARLRRDLGGPFAHRAVAYEPGTAQRSCFEVDVEATRAAYRRYRAGRPAALEAEHRFLREAGVRAVLADVPALAVRAAAEAGLPAVVMGNFTWDWILEPYLEGTGLAELPALLAEDYAGARAHLRLPFGPERSPCPRSEAAPLVCRSASLPPAALRRRLGLPEREARALVLVCPGGWDPEAWEPIRAPGAADLRYVTVGDLPVRAAAPLTALPHALPPGIELPDLVAAADVVLAKPGYGIASECLFHRTPAVFVERPGFRETPVLLEAMRAAGRCAALPLADFFAGRWEPALREALASRRPWRAPEAPGAPAVARRVAELLEL